VRFADPDVAAARDRLLLHLRRRVVIGQPGLLWLSDAKKLQLIERFVLGVPV